MWELRKWELRKEFIWQRWQDRKKWNYSHRMHLDKLEHDADFLCSKLRVSRAFFCFSLRPKHFQSLSVSSAPALTTMSLSGDMAIIRTRLVWPTKSQTFTMSWYRHMVSWFIWKPWLEINSLCSFDHKMHEICDLTSWVCRIEPL